MGFLLKLVWRDFLRHRSMLTFAMLAIASTCCLIVWFVASIDLASMAEDNGAGDYFGKYTLVLHSNGNLDQAVTDQVEGMEQVSRYCYAWQGKASMQLENFPEALKPSGMGERPSPMLLGMGDMDNPFEVEEGRWFQKPMECVVGTAAEKVLTAVPGQKTEHEIKIGDKIKVTTDKGSFVLTVAGKVEQKILKDLTKREGGQTFAFGFGLGIGGGTMGGAGNGPAPGKTPAASGKGQGGAPGMRRGGPLGQKPTGPTQASLYVSLEDAGVIGGDRESVNMMFVQLDKEYGEDRFYASLEESLGGALGEFGVRASDRRPPKKEGEGQSGGGDTGEAIISQAWSTIGIVIIASVFIIFTTLSMGVSEKVRYLAMLRTVGFTRSQVGMFIMLEGLFLGLLGWLGGMLSGWALLTVLLYVQSGVFPIVTLKWQCVLFALCCSIFGALIASVLPALRATRISPAESMVRKTGRLSSRQLILSGIGGILLLACIPSMIFFTSFDVKVKVMLFSTVGTLCLGSGFLLIFPWMLEITEKALGPLLARCFGFHGGFLSRVLTGNQWRTLGTTIALSIGLGLFTAIHIWSSSMLNMFTVPKTIPDVLVRFQEGVISSETAAEAARMEGIAPGRFMRTSVAQPNTDWEMQARLREAGTMAGNVVVMGVDADAAWREKDPMIRLDFVEGSRKKAFQAFSEPGARCCVIPETLAVLGGIKVGDKLKLEKSAKRRLEVRGESADEELKEYAEYTVVGVVDFPWVWFSKCSGVRVSAGRTAALIFTPYEAPLADFGSLDREFFWFDTRSGIGFSHIEEYMRGVASEGAKRAPDAKRKRSYSGGTRWDSGINRNYVQVSSNESLNNSLNYRAFGVIKTMTRMPLIILILSTIAVINTMVVSVRSRRWEMGVLRACGVTRFGLVRMILAESVLIGLCACVMSFSFGLFYAWVAAAMVEYAPVFGVIAPPMTVPWSQLATGYLLAIALCAFAGMQPAVSTGFTETSTLLQRRE